MPITERQKQHLRALAHSLKPVVMIGQGGVSAGVVNETDLALNAHELIKVKISAGDRELRDEGVALLCERCTAELVQRIGNMAVLYRPNPKKKRPIPLPPD